LLLDGADCILESRLWEAIAGVGTSGAPPEQGITPMRIALNAWFAGQSVGSGRVTGLEFEVVHAVHPRD
jgi:hypothetical protein